MATQSINKANTVAGVYSLRCHAYIATARAMADVKNMIQTCGRNRKDTEIFFCKKELIYDTPYMDKSSVTKLQSRDKH
jgi:hypothetical protein